MTGRQGAAGRDAQGLRHPVEQGDALVSELLQITSNEGSAPDGNTGSNEALVGRVWGEVDDVDAELAKLSETGVGRCVQAAVIQIKLLLLAAEAQVLLKRCQEVVHGVEKRTDRAEEVVIIGRSNDLRR